MTSTSKEILSRLEAAGFMTAGSYTHDRLLDEMKGFERATLREVFQDGYSDSLRAYDLAAHFRNKSSQYALFDTEVYGRLSATLALFSRNVSSLVNGARGERYLARALGWLTCPNEVLLNVELEHDGERCEYDAIVFTPSGVDIVESKFFNYDAVIDGDGFFGDLRGSRCRRYNVGEKMRAKEHVLFKVLEQASPGAAPRFAVRSILFIANNNARVDDRFGLVDICYSGQLCRLIEGRALSVLDEGTLPSVAAAVEDARQTFMYEPEIDFDQLRSDIADFIVMVERAAERATAREVVSMEVQAEESPAIEAAEPRFTPLNAGAVVLSTIAVAAAGFGAARAIKKIA